MRGVTHGAEPSPERAPSPPSPTGLTCELLDTVEALEPHRDQWDALAVAARRPYCAPAWMLAWFRHAARPGAQLRVAVARDGEHLAAIAPFCVERGRAGMARYRLLASGASAPIEPLARPGLEGRAAAAFAATLAAARPRPSLVTLEGVEAGSPWPGLLARAWPGALRPLIRRERARPAPTLSLRVPTFDDWLASKSGNFRQQLRRSRRQLEARGARFRMTASKQELERDLEAFARLHHARWDFRGGSRALDPGVERMLRDAGRELIGEERFRLWCVDVGGATIGCELCLAAGGEVAYWLGGFDAAWAAQRPSLQGLAAAIEDAIARGEDRFDLGPGARPYKHRFADGEDTLEWLVLLPRDPRYPLTRARIAPAHLRRALSRRLPPSLKARLRSLLRPGRGRGAA